jgi:hypothetical protein
VVRGDNALNAERAVVCPVPPFTMAIVVPFQTPDVIVPTDVSEELITVEFKTVPLNVPAGATTTLPEAAVTKPFPFTVKDGIDVEEPKDPVLEFTVAKVAAAIPGPEAVTSPVSDVI